MARRARIEHKERSLFLLSSFPGFLVPIIAAQSALLTACVGSEPLLLPIDPSAGSVLFAIREGDEKARIFAYPPDAVPPLAIADQDLFLLSYPVAIEALGLARGEQPRPGDADPARPFPPGFRAFRSNADRDGWSELTPDEVEAELGDRVLMAVPACEASGGCYRRREETRYEFCELPCAETPDPLAPTPPAPPALPDFGTCPRGWITRASVAADTTYCEPPPLIACQPESTQFLGEEGCSRVGAECPSDGWPAVLPPGRTVHFVRAGATGDGTSKSSPFGTIAAAVAAAAPLDVVALYAGPHAGGATVDRSLAIRGACSISAIVGGAPALQVAAGATVELGDLEIAPDGDGIAVDGTAMLDGVTITGGARGAYVLGTLIARELSVRGASEGGLVASGGAEIRADRVHLAGSTRYGVRLDDGATGRFADLLVSGSRAHPGGEFESFGYGALATDGGRLIVTRALFEENDGNAVSAWYSATASITMIVDRDGNGGYSFDLDRSAIGEASRIVTLRALSGSVWTFRSGEARVTDVYVRESGGGLFGRLGGRLNASRVLLEENSFVGVESSGASSLVLEDLTIRDQSAEAIFIAEASLDADRVQIVRPTGHGIDVRGSAAAQAAANLTDLLVTGVRPRSAVLGFDCFGDGSGLRVLDDSRVEVTRALFEGGARGIGFDSFDEHSLQHVLIRGAQRQGLCASNGSYDVSNLRIEEVAGRGIELFGGYLETNNLAVVGTKKIAGVESSGIGVYLYGLNNIMDVRIAVLPLRIFLLSGNESRGILMDNGSQAMLEDGEIAGSEIGIELVNQPAFDPTALYTNVIFRNNGSHLVF